PRCRAPPVHTAARGQDSRSPNASTTEECGRSTAWQNDAGGFAEIAAALPYPHNMLEPGGESLKRRPAGLQAKSPGHISASHGAPPGSRRDGASTKLLTDARWTSFRFDRKRGLRWLSRATGGGDRLVPGCLTGESEERETWTAGSLRAASS